MKSQKLGTSGKIPLVKQFSESVHEEAMMDEQKSELDERLRAFEFDPK